MHIVTLSPLGNYTVYIDAVNGNVLKTTNYIDASNAVGTAYTKYSGTVSLNTDSYSGGFRLYDGTRGQGIETKNAQKTNDPWNAIAFSDNNNNWTVAEFHNQNMDDAALDAHYCAQKTYDFFKNVLLRNSYDSNNAKVSLYAHYTTLPNHLGWNDAIWIRTLNFMALGDGDGVICSPLTSCDVYNTPHFLYQRYCLLS
jgi:Zn-dependent metalloprotease